MAEKLDQSEVVSFRELLLSNVYTQEALINLLERKGLISIWVGGIGAGQNLLPRGSIKGKEPGPGAMGPVSALNP